MPWLVCCFLLTLVWPMAVSAQVNTPLLSVHGAENSVPVTASSQVLEDPQGTLTLAQVRSAAAGWQPGPPDALVFGYTHSSWWVHTRIENASSHALNMVLDLGSPRQDHVHWFVVRQGGASVEESVTGDRLPFAQRPLPSRNFALPLALAPQERVEIYTRLASHDGLYEAMPLQLSTRRAFEQALERETMLTSLFHGALVALALYNLLLFVATRERAFGLYVAYLFSFIAWSFTFRGYSFQYLWPEATGFNNDFLSVSSAGIFAFNGAFAISYLRMRELAPRWVLRLNQVMVALNIAVWVPALAGHYALGAMFGWAVGLPLAATTIGTAVWLLFRGSRPARFYAVAFTMLAVGGGAYILQIVKLVPANAFTTWGIQVGSVIEVLLLALGLADSMNTLKAAKLAAERREREAQHALTTELEQQVRSRTRALEQANSRLGELAITDELTGAFNRRHFNDFCAQLLTGSNRGDPLAFCMFDIDKFKAYNDMYGHQSGDGALREVATAVQRELKRSGDFLFRLGGEEFGVLFTARAAASAADFVERLRLAVYGLQRPHAGASTGFLTASFGVAWWSTEAAKGLTPERMYAQADHLLYAAKTAGRNRVEVAALTA